MTAPLDALITATQDHLRFVNDLDDDECRVRWNRTVPARKGELFIGISPFAFEDGPSPDPSSFSRDDYLGFTVTISRRTARYPDDRVYKKVLAEEAKGILPLLMSVDRVMMRDRYVILANANLLLGSCCGILEPFRRLQSSAEVRAVGEEHFMADPSDIAAGHVAAIDYYGVSVSIGYGQARYLESMLSDAPVANFVGNVLTGDAPLTVQFANHTQGAVFTHAWTFGDTESSILPSPEHVYANPGTYEVELVVVGPGGTDTETKTDYVVVT